MKNTFLFILFSLLFGLTSVQSFAQCSNAINTFPYQEGFENSSGDWTTGGGTWQWGTPSKKIIDKAGSGSKCWVAGGLASGQLYNASENSWLQSPCFDFAGLSNPYITFKIVWEVEWKWDAVTFEYSVDGGSSWAVLGTSSSGTDCLNANWYNATGSKQGWSGNVQPSGSSGGYTCEGGYGSGGWLTAKHVMTMLAGKTNVVFRFHFSGSPLCREYYEGFGVDDIVIKETPVAGVSFNYNCSANNTVNFTNSSGGCPTGYLWNFGDVLSGANNTSTDENPIHIFSSPGTYTVKLTAYYTGGTVLTSTQIFTVINVAPTIVNSIKCNGDPTGMIAVNTTPVSSSYNYSWNTNPVQTSPSIGNLAAGVYAVTVMGTNVCTTTQSIALTQPDTLKVAPTITDTKCGKASGAITTSVTGGTAPYNYTWSNSATTSTINNLNVGNYAFTVTDANGCKKDTTGLMIKNVDNIINLFLGNDTAICVGEKVVLDAGDFASYKWQNNSTDSIFIVTRTGDYSVTVIDKDGCTAKDEIVVRVDCSDVFFPSAFTPNNDGRNDDFGPAGNNLLAVKSYTMQVYNRFGQLVFETTNPYKRWDGKFKGTLATGTFVWLAKYKIVGRIPYNKKGTITIIN